MYLLYQQLGFNVLNKYIVNKIYDANLFFAFIKYVSLKLSM